MSQYPRKGIFNTFGGSTFSIIAILGPARLTVQSRWSIVRPRGGRRSARQRQRGASLPRAALRSHVVKDIGHCLSQPYDVISAAQQEAYYRQHPYNVIRLDPEQGGARRRGDNQPLHARPGPLDRLARGRGPATHRPALLLGLRAGVRPPRDRPQDGERLHRRGAAARLRGAPDPPPREGPEGAAGGPDPAHGGRPAPSSNTSGASTRTRRTSSTTSWTSRRGRRRSSTTRRSPSTSATACGGSRTPTRARSIRRTMARLKIYIADGHHRYQTMLTIRDRMRRRFPDAGPDAPWEYIMMFLVNSEHEGLTILPTHRMLHGIQVESLFKLGADILEHFHVKKYVFRDGDEPEVRRRWLRDLRDVGPGEHTFGAYIVNTNGLLPAHPARRGSLRGAGAAGQLLRVEAPGREHPEHAHPGRASSASPRSSSASPPASPTPRTSDEALEKVRAGRDAGGADPQPHRAA